MPHTQYPDEAPAPRRAGDDRGAGRHGLGPDHAGRVEVEPDDAAHEEPHLGVRHEAPEVRAVRRGEHDGGHGAHLNLLSGSAGSDRPRTRTPTRSEEHTSELQSLMRISYAVLCLKKTNNTTKTYY